MKAVLFVVPVLCLALVSAATAQGFKPYPGSAPDEAAAKAAMQAAGSGTRVAVYITGDPFEKVAAFYKTLYKEYQMPRKAGTLPNGQQIKWAFFILDGAPDLSTSKSWMKVQWPYVGEITMQGSTPQFKDIRDVTVIEAVEKK